MTLPPDQCDQVGLYFERNWEIYFFTKVGEIFYYFLGKFEKWSF